MPVRRFYIYLIALLISLPALSEDLIIEPKHYGPLSKMTDLWLKGEISRRQIRELALRGRYVNNSDADSAYVSFFLDEMQIIARGTSVSGRSAQINIQVNESKFDLDYDLVSMHLLINGHGSGLSNEQKFLLIVMSYRLAAEGWSKSLGVDQMEKSLIYRTLNYLSRMPTGYKMWGMAKEIKYPLH
ncbi:hypothetical protein [Microbulbifer epialgicus]|uniref:DUF4390 domain-containing protein n=1 Tax=Microbulbifer epialgicus TaxID=393907 RepID=A0ABV4P1Z1_9GAMM